MYPGVFRVRLLFPARLQTHHHLLSSTPLYGLLLFCCTCTRQWRALIFRPIQTCLTARRAASSPTCDAHYTSRVVGATCKTACRGNTEHTGDRPAVLLQVGTTPAGSDKEELPSWVRREKERELQAAAPKSLLPWPLMLLFSSFCAMASVGSMFEIANKHPLFGVIQPDNFLWFPVLGLFAATGLPTAGERCFRPYSPKP